MKTHGDKFIIKYEKGSVRNYDLGSGIVIEIAAECNMDIRGNSDQVGIVISAPEGHTFFKNGDKVLIFAQAGKAILYRMSENKIIEVEDRSVFTRG